MDAQDTREGVVALLVVVVLAGLALIGLNWHYNKAGTTSSIATSSLKGDAQRGRMRFVAVGCKDCHSIAGVAEASGTLGPALDGVADRAGRRVAGTSAATYLRQSIEQPQAYVVSGYLNAMPGMAREMSPQELEDVVAFLMTLRERQGAAEPHSTNRF